MTTPPEKIPELAADAVIQDVLKLPNDPASLRHWAGQYLIGAVEVWLLVPFIFKLRFGEVGPLGWGTSVFLSVYCILSAIGLLFRYKPEYHTKVALKGDWKDRVGAFWLVACVFGPFFSWVLVNVVPITASTWQGVYWLRVFLAAGLPLLTALPLFRYVRGKAALVSLPMLVIVTLIPVSTAFNSVQDLREGPRDGTLVHTARVLAQR